MIMNSNVCTTIKLKTKCTLSQLVLFHPFLLSLDTNNWFAKRLHITWNVDSNGSTMDCLFRLHDKLEVRNVNGKIFQRFREFQVDR